MEFGSERVLGEVVEVSSNGVEREERWASKEMRLTRLESEDAEECPVQKET
jgi:hypothetical protein